MIVCPTSIDFRARRQVLMQNWRNLGVDQNYQNLMLAYLQVLPQVKAQELIYSEFAVHEDKTRYERLNERQRERQKQLIQLRNLVDIDQFNIDISRTLLSEISQFLNDLRETNLEIVEELLALNQEYLKDHKQTPIELKQFLLGLDSQIQFLKSSFLNKFILFQEQYDPFFLYHYQMRNKITVSFNHPAIDRVFDLSIAFSSRLSKAQKNAMNLLGLASEQRKIFKRKSKSLVPQKKISLTVDYSDQIEGDSKRQTSTNFKVRTLTLKKVNDKEIFSPASGYKLSTFKTAKNSIFNQQKIQQLTKNSESSDEQPTNLLPIKFKKSKHLPRTHFLQDIIKNARPNDQKASATLNQQKISFKGRLLPINSKNSRPQLSDAAQSKCNTSKFSNKTLQQIQKSNSIQKHSQDLNSQELNRDTIEEKTDLKSTNDSQRREVKMRPGKLLNNEFAAYIRSLSIASQLKNEVLLNDHLSTECNQSYLSEFFSNGELMAVGVSIPLPEGDYLIKLWGPLRNCSEETSKLLFSKYLNYLQKQTSCSSISYSGSLSQLALSLNFIAKNDNLLLRNRLSPKIHKQFQFPQFLSLKCSNILFPQVNEGINMLYSDEIQPFNQRNYYIQPALAEINKQSLSRNLLLMSKISEQISDMKALNSLLEDEGFDTYEVTSAMKISTISVARLAENIKFKSPFVAGEGYFKFQGEELFRKDGKLICQIEGLQEHSSIILGKGFSNIHSFIDNSKKAKKKPCEFSVKMFSKQLYGRMINNCIDKCSYGNWQFSLSWRDEIQGRLKHTMTSCESFGPQPFYLGILIQSQLTFCFQVSSEDFLF